MSRADMVHAYAESLLEQVLKTDRVRPDKDGDYPVVYKSAQYYVRIDAGQNDDPVVQVFAKVLADVTPRAELFEQLNEINTQLRFARIFWVRDQVLVESEMPGMALSLEGLVNACNTVGGAADYFGPRLAEVFEEKSAFAVEKGPDYEEPESWPGQYL